MKKALALVLPASVLGVVLGVLAVSRVPWLEVGYGPFVPSVAVALVLLVTAIAALLLGALRWLWPLCIGLVAQLFGLLLLYKEWWGFSTPWKPVWWTLAAIGAVLLVMGAIWLVVTVRTRWFERKMLQGVGDAGAEELEAIRKNFQDALGKLRRAGHGRNAIYELPWSLVIGRPQGGKTTAIKNSGLGLPVRKDWVKGVGGTVNVDFFFTNDLIFMDTPGRWVTDGANEREQRQWTELLRLLRRFRGHRPVDGLVVAVPVDDLLSLSEDALRDQASRVREILDRLHGELRFRFPVYLIVTKCDLVDGFVEFFQGLPVQRRHEILGWSNPDPNRGSAARLLGVALPRMLRRLEAYRLEMLARMASSTRARKLFFFPEEFRRLVSPLGVYADELFHRDSYRETPVFRGLYFTSGTQGEGSPLGQALADFARNLGVRVPPVAPQEEEEQKRSYFLLQLFRDLMVQDEGLVGRTAGQWWARRRNTLFGAVLPAAVSIFFVSLAGVSFALNRGTWERAGREVPEIVDNLKDAELTFPEVLNRTERLRQLDNDVMGSIFRSFGMRRGGDLRPYTFQAFQASFKGRLLAPTLQAGQDLLGSSDKDCANKIDLVHAILWLRSGSRIDVADTAAFEQLWGIDSEEERDLLGRQFRHLLRYSTEKERRELLPGLDLAAAAREVRDTCGDAGARSTLERYLVLERRCQKALSSEDIESCYTGLVSVLRETPEDYARRQARLTNLKTDMEDLAEEGQAGASEAAEILQAMRLPDREAKACFTQFDTTYRPQFFEYVNRPDLIDICRAQVKGAQSAVEREKGFAAIWLENAEDLRAREANLKEAVITFEKTCRSAGLNFNGFNFPVLRDATKGGIRVICVDPPPTPEVVVQKAKSNRERSTKGGGGVPLVQLRYFEHLPIPADYRADGWQRKKKEWNDELALKDNYSHAQYQEKTRQIEDSVEVFAQHYVEFWRKYLREVRLHPRPDAVSVPDWVQGLATTQEYRQVVDDAVLALTTIHETEPPFNAMEARVAGFTQLAQYQGDISEYQQSLQQVAQDLRQISTSDREWRKYKKDLASKPLGIALARVGGYGGSDRLPVSVFKEPLLEAKAFVDGKESTSQDWPDLVKLAKGVGDGYPLSLDGDPVPEGDLVRLSGLVRRLKDSNEAEPASDAAVWLSRANDVSTLLFDENDAPRKLRVQWIKESESFDKPDLAEKIEVRKIHLKLGEGIDWDAEPGKKDNKTLHVPLTGEDAPKDSELSVTLGIRKKFGKVLPGSNWKEQTPSKPVSGTGAPWKLVVLGLQPAGLEGYAGGTPQLEYAFPIKDGEKQLGLLKIRFRLEGEDVPRFLTLLKDGLPPPPATAF